MYNHSEYHKTYYVANAPRIRGRVKAWRENNPDRVKEYGKEHQKSGRALLNRARARAWKKGLPFNLVLNDIVVPEFCPVLGIRLVFGDGHSTPASPTVDRLKPELGYVRGNIQVMSHRANTIKSNASAEEVEKVAAWMRKQTARADV
jgi:hypothetical protein